MDGSARTARVIFLFPAGSGALLVLWAALPIRTAHADALSAVQVLRQGGCGGIVPLARPLLHSASLDRAAEDWAGGDTLDAAAARNGYRPVPRGVHLRASENTVLEVLRRTECRGVTDRTLREIGLFRRGEESWLVLAGERAARHTQPRGLQESPARPREPAGGDAPEVTVRLPQLATQALVLVNQARSHGGRCGGRMFAPAPPVRLSGTLGGVAFGHAADMAQHNYFEHEDLAGHSPADRVRAVGYKEKLVGENIAYGPASVEEAVQGWLKSPDHCENIMDPRFAEMGIASATGRSSRHGLYWVQVLAEPRA